MSILRSSVDPSTAEYAENRAAMLERLAHIDELQAEAVAGGGERYVQRHLDRGRMLARQRIEMLVDPDSPFLELSSVAGAHTEFTVGGSVVTGIGQISGTECFILANDPTVKGGSLNPISVTSPYTSPN